VFDLFGTLLDIASLRAAAGRHTTDPAALVATWREKQLGYAFAATIMQRYASFDELTERALEYALARHGVALDAAAFAALAQAWCRVEPYPEARAVLEELHARRIPCAVLTNGTRATAHAAMDAAGIGTLIDVTLSVDDVRAYKPDPRVYALATAHYETTADQLVFVTSNGWDATGAAEAGLRVAWCNRLGAPAETFGATPDWTFSTLAELPALVA